MATTPRQTSKPTAKQPRASTPKAKQPPTTIRRIGADLYWVSSASHPGTGHQVTPQSCTCPASRHGRPDCRHRALVRMYDAWRREQQAAAQGAASALDSRSAAVAAQGTATAELAPLSRHFE